MGLGVRDRLTVYNCIYLYIHTLCFHPLTFKQIVADIEEGDGLPVVGDVGQVVCDVVLVYVQLVQTLHEQRSGKGAYKQKHDMGIRIGITIGICIRIETDGMLVYSMTVLRLPVSKFESTRTLLKLPPHTSGNAPDRLFTDRWKYSREGSAVNEGGIGPITITVRVMIIMVMTIHTDYTTEHNICYRLL